MKKEMIKIKISKKRCLNIELEDFKLAYEAKLIDSGVTKQSVIDDAIEEAVEYCNDFECGELESISPINLSLGIDNRMTKKGVLDLVGILSLKNKENVFGYSDENGKKQFLNYSTIVISDGLESVESIAIFSDNLRSTIIQKTKYVQKMIVRGFFVPVLQKNKTYKRYLYVMAIFDYEGNYRAYGFSNAEISYAEKLINKHQENLQLFLYQNVRDYFQIKNLKNNFQLKTCLENAILQSLSSNRIGSYNGWIHSVVWGPPSTGKNFLIRLLELLTLEFREGQSGKITTAGLLSACNSKDGKYVSEPGLLVLAQNGYFAIQDFHSVEDNKKKLIYGIWSKLMQDGFAVDSTAAKTIYKVLTGIHIDANKLSRIRSVKAGEEINILDDYGVEVQILTRFDFIMDIIIDSETRYMTAKKSLNSNNHNCEIENPEKTFKLIIAILRERYPEITISEEVLKVAQLKLDSFYNDNKDIFEKVEIISDFPQRMMVSVKKYLHAIARLNCRSYSKIEDVDYAMRFLSPKLDFLKNYAPELQTDGMLGKSQKTRICQKYIMEYFGKESFSLSDVIKAMKESDDLTVSRNVSDRTVRRYVEAIAYQVKRDTWKIKKTHMRK